MDRVLLVLFRGQTALFEAVIARYLDVCDVMAGLPECKFQVKSDGFWPQLTAHAPRRNYVMGLRLPPFLNYKPYTHLRTQLRRTSRMTSRTAGWSWRNSGQTAVK